MQVLDKGHVELVDHMGSDLSIVNAARVSFAKQSDWETARMVGGGDTGPLKWITKLKASDAKLIHYLASHNHTSPFRHTCISLRIKAPIFVARQLGKHQVGLTWNEVSRRYVDSDPEFYWPEVWRARPDNSIKQGSTGVVDELYEKSWSRSYVQHENGETEQEWGYSPTDPKYWQNSVEENWRVDYESLLAAGVAPEMARMVLPQSTYTEWIWTGSLQAFFHVWVLRAKADAQWEAQQYAQAIAAVIEPLFPESWKALTNALEAS